MFLCSLIMLWFVRFKPVHKTYKCVPRKDRRTHQRLLDLCLPPSPPLFSFTNELIRSYSGDNGPLRSLALPFSLWMGHDSPCHQVEEEVVVVESSGIKEAHPANVCVCVCKSKFCLFIKCQLIMLIRGKWKAGDKIGHSFLNFFHLFVSHNFLLLLKEHLETFKKICPQKALKWKSHITLNAGWLWLR